LGEPDELEVNSLALIVSKSGRVAVATTVSVLTPTPLPTPLLLRF
jgi:hypothetical protein